jgi:nitrate/nitrite transporter NarK
VCRRRRRLLRDGLTDASHLAAYRLDHVATSESAGVVAVGVAGRFGARPQCATWLIFEFDAFFAAHEHLRNPTAAFLVFAEVATVCICSYSIVTALDTRRRARERRFVET